VYVGRCSMYESWEGSGGKKSVCQSVEELRGTRKAQVVLARACLLEARGR
jgi:hypothetical protein